MHKKITFLTAMLVLLALPHVGNAQSYDYIPSTEFFSQFATPRTAETLVEKQRKAAEARRNEAQSEYFAAQEPEEETLRASADEEPAPTNQPPTENLNTFLSPETLSTLRALERIEKQRQEAELRSQALQLLGADVNGLNLHSGAPLGTTGKGGDGKGGTPQFLPTNNPNLAPTGAASYIAILAVLVAAVVTIWYGSTTPVLRRVES